jgi:hypothetical protein
LSPRSWPISKSARLQRWCVNARLHCWFDSTNNETTDSQAANVAYWWNASEPRRM